MQEEKKITIIIPVYNVEDYVGRCIESVITQDYCNLEILLVDDGSTDNSGKICDEYAVKDSRIRVIHKKNGGLSSARNIALEQMKGDYIFFIDSDDFIYPGILSSLMSACIDYDADISCCGYVSGNKSYYCNKQLEVIDSVEATKRMFICDGLDANAVCKLYRKELFENIRYPLCAYEVVPVTYRVLLRTNKIVNLYKPGYYIEKRNGSITRSLFGTNNLLYAKLSKDEYEIIKKEYPELEDYAYVFYLTALISMRERAEDDPACKQSVEYKEINDLFKKNYDEIKTNKLLSKRKKIIAILIKCKVYEVIKKVYSLFYVGMK